MKKRGLIVLNLILLISIIALCVKENYFVRIINKINTQSKTYDKFDSTFEYKHEIDLYKIYKKKGSVVMLGNSITYRVNWNELLNRNDIINRGIGKDITKGFYNRLDYVINVDPQLCFIMGGINDILKNIPQKEIVDNLHKIIKALKNKSIKPFIFSVLYVSDIYPRHKTINKTIKHLNNKLMIICKTENIEFIDLNTSLSEKSKLKKQYSSIDGLHLNSEGYEAWEKVISPIINRELKQ